MAKKLDISLVMLVAVIRIHMGDTTSADSCCKLDASNSEYRCQGCGLVEVPSLIPANITTLDLSENYLKSIKDFAFTNLSKLVNLYLSNNEIRYLDKYALRGLKSLKELDLRHNKLCVDDASFKDIFNTVKRLTTLQLANNNECNGTIKSYPDKALEPLRVLEKLSLPFAKNAVLSPVFGKLTKLKYLMILGPNGLYRDGGNLGCNTFEKLENVSLEMLSLRNTGIQTICPTALMPLKSLKYLNYACNKNLSVTDVIETVNKLPKSTLETLIIDRTGAGVGEIDLSSFGLTDSWNKTQKFSARFMNTRHLAIRNADFLLRLSELTYLGVPANMIWTSYSKDLTEKMIEFYNITKVETIDQGHFGGTGYREDDFYSRYCVPDNIHDEPDLFFHKPPSDVFPPVAPEHNDFDVNAPWEEGKFFARNLPLSLHYLYLDHFTFGMMDVFQFNINPLNQILMVKISNSNVFGRLKTLKNANNLQIVDARKCGFNNLAKKPLNYSSLQQFLLGDNNLANIGTEEATWSPFQLMTKLKLVDLENNKIKYVQPGAFTNLPLLEEIKLHGNQLSLLNLNFTGSYAVRKINASHNFITTVSSMFMQSVDKIAAEHSMLVDLSGNQLDCSCDSLPTIKWLQTTGVYIENNSSLKCENGALINHISITAMNVWCFLARTHLDVVLVTVTVTAVVVIVLGIIYKKRWRIIFRYYILKDHMRDRRNGTENLVVTVDNFVKDVFISCALKDSDWLYEEVVPRLEELWGYTSFSRRRDVEIGEPKTSSVAALNTAITSMCIISPNFCNDGVCQWELNMILAKGDESVLFLYKDPIDQVEDPYVHRIIQHYNHIEYGTSDAERQNCWETLRNYIEANVRKSRPNS